MTTSLVALNGKGFWSPDSLLEIFAHFLAEELAKLDTPWATSYTDHLQVQATAGLTGCIDFRLASLDEDAKKSVLRAAENVVVILRRKPRALSAQSLTMLNLGGGAVFESDVDLEMLVKLKSVFHQLLSGDWHWSPEDDAALHTRWLDPAHGNEEGNPDGEP